ncbi:sigma-70 family RNA polymerase sigma factor [Nocardiopsis sp. HNM0947]|uniref:RNA polymerase sigma factor n=1 Tax=Nocardiopsis coralli TaxID=2772213 RepID=A0ABR9P4W0_9ACTN|nr:sigma-70 family RNA polymerase sigma factor [Nocardiopsis coralli]MBE2998860.1 sigma-70 family RNA polymerase sigma factor [Nocardiopsis coralli]
MGHTEARGAVEAVWRIESGRLVAVLTRMVGDVGTAEEVAQDALVSALETWPREGTPRNPAAWLTTVAKRRVVDRWRRDARFRDRLTELGREAALHDGQNQFDAVEDDYGDDLLRLVFVCCHPVLPVASRVALTLRLLGGLTTAEVARAFLLPEPTVAQRIVRAKRTLREKNVRFEVPAGDERDVRLASVLSVVHLVFNEGYVATAGDDWMRPELAEEALYLGRVLVRIMPGEPEAHGLLALMELHASRFRARCAPDGTPVPLEDQDRTRWDRRQVARGLATLERSVPAGPNPTRGPYALQAAIAAEHARAPRTEDTDWGAIADLYGELVRATRSPVAELNRAVALSMDRGPRAALTIVDTLADEPAMERYPLFFAVRGDLLLRLGYRSQARAEFEHAAMLTDNGGERVLLQRRARGCVPVPGF